MRPWHTCSRKGQAAKASLRISSPGSRSSCGRGYLHLEAAGKLAADACTDLPISSMWQAEQHMGRQGRVAALLLLLLMTPLVVQRPRCLSSQCCQRRQNMAVCILTKRSRWTTAKYLLIDS